MTTATDTRPVSLSLTDAALIFGISRSAAYQEVRRTGNLAGLPVFKVGGVTRMSVGTVARFFEVEVEDIHRRLEAGRP